MMSILGEAVFILRTAEESKMVVYYINMRGFLHIVIIIVKFLVSLLLDKFKRTFEILHVQQNSHW